MYPPGQHQCRHRPRPHISRYPWLEFVPTSNGLAAKVHLQVDSYPRTEWKLRLQEVDRFGAFVVVHHQQEQVIENSGTIERFPHFENLIATFPSNGGAKGALYQISIETVWTEQGSPVRWGEAMPLTLDLPTAARSRVFRAESLKLEQANLSVQATVKAEVVSWPKSHWRLTLELADPEGKRLGRGESSAENIGAIISRPSWSDALFQFPISGDLQALVTVQRWTLRIEALAQEPVK